MRPSVLVVDDDRGNLELVERALSSRAELLLATDAQKALEQVATARVDLCLCALAGPAGLELLKGLKERHPAVGRILVSAQGDASVLLSAINDGAAFKFVPKPFTEEQLAAAVDEFFRSNRVPEHSDLILLADDNVTIRNMMARVLEGAGFQVIAVADGEEATRVVHARGDALTAALIDLEMPKIGGLEVVGELKRTAPGVPAIIVSGHVSHQLALDCMAWGAFDFIGKPVSREELLFRMKRAVRERQRLVELSAFRAAVGSSTTPLVAQSPAMQQVLARASAMARTDLTVLITGETGTGKDAVAREIHRLSRRSAGQFLAVNCAALPENLLESELFGHEKGAFTGAVARREGFFEVADEGTLFLDEIGEISPATQAKLLRVLELKEFSRVGSSTTTHVDVRVIAATNSSLEDLVKAGRFRQDLYYRLYVMPLHLPPLRDRPEDIDGLVRMALRRAAPERTLSLSPAALASARAHPWPGNIRELFHCVERAVALTSGDRLDDLGLPPAGSPSAQGASGASAVSTLEALKDVVANATAVAERAYLQALLAETHGNLGETARRARVDRKSIYNKMRLYGLDKDQFKE